MRIKSGQNFWAGIMFAGLGLGFCLLSTEYEMGTAARMGPGYFPFWLSLCLAALGAGIALHALSPGAEEDHVERFDWRTLGIIIGSVVLFGVLLQPLGLYLSLLILVIGSSLASHEFHWKVALGTAAFLIIFSWLAFVEGLGLTFSLFPEFFYN